MSFVRRRPRGKSIINEIFFKTVKIELRAWIRRRYFLIDRLGTNTLRDGRPHATPHTRTQRNRVYMAKLGSAALYAWPFLKPNLVFAFSAGGLLFSFSLSSSHLQLCHRVFPSSNPLGPTLSTILPRCCRACQKKKKNKKFRKGVSYPIVSIVLFAGLCVGNRRNDVTPRAGRVIVVVVADGEYEINCGDTPHKRAKHRRRR